MISEAEFLYFTDVLGVQPFLDVDPVVLVSALNTVEQALLDKILQSIPLKNVCIKELQACELRDVLELRVPHVLTFYGADEMGAPEVVDLGNGHKWWKFFSPQWMLTENEQQNIERKKQAWRLLQKFKSEALT